ncbi:MAG: DUF3127 domain-containing protein [Cytophagales bacterium]|nr:MAG: DUF3127 domain-containing protein [Cytophagales bacterium]
MALEFVGKLIKVMPEIGGQSAKGPWKKQDFLIEEITGQYPKKACFQAWNEKLELLHKYEIGDELKISFNIESREYNEKWYTELRVWKIDAAGNNSSKPSNSREQSDDFPEVSSFKSSGTEEGDLPF